ncbi:MAG: general secretion pathway protein GspB [Gammaproteobacteria bacterium]
MSYILDALQKANVQRQQGTVPGLDSGVLHAGLAAQPPDTRRRWIWLASGLAGALLLLTTLWWWDDRTSPATPAAVLASSAPESPAGGDRSSAPASGRVFDALGPILTAPPQAPASSDSSAGRSASAVPADKPAPVASVSDAAGLTVAGSTYSENPLHRMLIVNGQVVREGEELRPGLRLEVIGPRSAILNDRGRRFNLNY